VSRLGARPNSVAKLKTKYPKGTIIRVIKLLYGIAEAGVH
jgi:hypothetical protein